MGEASWKEFWDRGISYLQLAERGLERPDKFNEEALYNIASMAIEGLFMGSFIASGGLPRNHTLTDLVEFEQERANFPPALAEGLLKMDGYQSLCSLSADPRGGIVLYSPSPGSPQLLGTEGRDSHAGFIPRRSTLRGRSLKRDVRRRLGHWVTGRQGVERPGPIVAKTASQRRRGRKA